MDYVLETRALYKKYRRFTALDDLNMHVPKGAIYGFVGKNGAGKTTLIRVVTGLQKPSGGEYVLYGVSSRERTVAKVRKRIGAVVETPSIYMDMTAEENLKAQYMTLGMPSYDGMNELLRLVGLTGTGHKKARNFSLGMRQRLGIAIALAGNPDLLILDEPVNGLDPQGIVEIRELILKLNREMGITVLISSHILDELSRIATHYGFIDKGHIVKEISAGELEESCKRKTVVTVSDTRLFVIALDRLHLPYQIIDDQTAELYQDITVSALSEAAEKAGCRVLTMREVEESLESFYMNLIGGGRNE